MRIIIIGNSSGNITALPPEETVLPDVPAAAFVWQPALRHAMTAGTISFQDPIYAWWLRHCYFV